MAAGEQIAALLAGYRVLDLCDERGILCGKALADMGAEVIAIEPPGGNPARRCPPFASSAAAGESSLVWLAYAAGKQSRVIDLESAAGREAFRSLARTADIVVESFGPGEMGRLGLGYDVLSGDNPRLILTSITSFGDGPRARALHGDDIAICAMGGMLFTAGDRDRPPVRMGMEQSHGHAGMEAAVGTMVALNARARIGTGQHVVVNAQACMAWTLMNEQAFPILHGDFVRRSGASVTAAGVDRRLIFPCKDGYVSLLIIGGPNASSTKALVVWIAEHLPIPEWLRERDFTRWEPAMFMEAAHSFVEEVRTIEALTDALFATRTKAEIYEEGVRRRILLAPVATVADIAVSPQLAARDYFVDVDCPQLGRALRLPGAFAKVSATPLRVRGPAPRLGENDGAIPERAPVAPEPRAAAQPGLTFDGMRVLDLAWVGVGPITSKYLADHGATAVRVESRSRLDVLRYGPPWTDGKPGFNRSQFYASYNSSKLGITLDLARSEARDIARRLVAWADVVVESFTPRVLAGWELDYEHLRGMRPDLIMLSTCLQGQTGPHRMFPGYGQLMAALSGFAEISGWPDRPPTPPYGAYTDFVAPRFSASVLMAAIDYRRRTGVGQYIDMSQFEASLHFLAPALIAYFLDGRVVTRDGNRSPVAAPHGVYRCAGDDRWVALAVRNDREWGACCRALQRADLATDTRFASLDARRRHAAALDAQIEAWTSVRPPEEAMQTLQEHGVPAGVVQNCLDLHQDPYLEEWGFWHWLDHPEMGSSPYEGHQFRLSKTPGTLRRPAPCLGEHNDYVLGDLLGMTREEIQRLSDEKILY